MKNNLKNILLVCTGNSCRSVMAAGLFRKILKQKNPEKFSNISIFSAGTYALEGMGPTKEAMRVSKREDIDISSNRAIRLEKNMIKQTDLILVMEKAHKEMILSMVPEAWDRVHLLKEFCNDKKVDDVEIRDPIGKPLEAYEECFIILKDNVERIVGCLKEE